MGGQARVVAVLVASPALGSILASVLAESRALRVRSFESKAALLAYLGLASVDLLVVDFDSEDSPAGDVSLALSGAMPESARRCDVIALSSTASPGMKRLATAAGIDEVIVKPMSPRYLLERVLARLARRPRAAQPPRTQLPAYAGNVVPLFGTRPLPNQP